MRSSRLAIAALVGAALTAAAAVTTPAPPVPAAGAPSRAEAAPNLLANPGFEDGRLDHPWMPAAWDTFPSELATVFFSRDTTLAHTGRYAVNVANLSTRFPMFHNWSQTLRIGPELWNKDVVFSIWSRSLSLQGRAYVLAQAFNDTIGRMALEWGVPRDSAMDRMGYAVTGQPIVLTAWKRRYFSEEETGWVQREVRIHVPPSSNLLAVRAGIFGTGQVAFDDASLTAGPALPPPAAPVGRNLIRDPGFEADGNDWEYSIPPFEGLHMERDTTMAHSGRACLHIPPAASGAIRAAVGVGQLLDGRGLVGKRLRWSVWVRVDNAVAAPFLRLRATTLDGELPAGYQEYAGGTNVWSRLSVERDVPPGCQLVGAYVEYAPPSPTHYYFDDAVLEVIGPAEYLRKHAQPDKPPPLPAPVLAPRR